MSPLLVTLLLALPQDPLVDDIAAKFPDPLPADRTWELALAYNAKICDLLRANEHDKAREWDRMARRKLPDPYRKRLSEKGASFWPLLRNYPGNRAQVEDQAAILIIALTGGDERDLVVLRKRAAKNPEGQQGLYIFDLALAHSWLAQGEFAKVLRHLTEMERDYPEAFVKSVREFRETVEDIQEAGAEAILKSASPAAWAHET